MRIEAGTLIRPQRLRRGDVIGIVSPSSPEKFDGRVERGVRYLERLGYRVEIGAHVTSRNGYLAGTDEERAADLNVMFANPNVRAILCTRGGYGAGRILQLLDWRTIRKNPKIFVGFSDGTAINLALMAKARLVSFSGALPGVDFWKDAIDPFTEEEFWRAITSPRPRGSISGTRVIEATGAPLRRDSGMAEGMLVGGNLALTAAAIGTPFFPAIQRPLWILEDVAEEPYRVDRMLTQLLSAGVMRSAAAVAFGNFVHCESSDKMTQSIEAVQHEFAERVDCPVFTGVPYGHVETKQTLPLGVRAAARSNGIRLLEAGVV